MCATLRAHADNDRACAPHVSDLMPAQQEDAQHDGHRYWYHRSACKFALYSMRCVYQCGECPHHFGSASVQWQLGCRAFCIDVTLSMTVTRVRLLQRGTVLRRVLTCIVLDIHTLYCILSSEADLLYAYLSAALRRHRLVTCQLTQYDLVGGRRKCGYRFQIGISNTQLSPLEMKLKSIHASREFCTTTRLRLVTGKGTGTAGSRVSSGL